MSGILDPRIQTFKSLHVNIQQYLPERQILLTLIEHYIHKFATLTKKQVGAELCQAHDKIELPYSAFLSSAVRMHYMQSLM